MSENSGSGDGDLKTELLTLWEDIKSFFRFLNRSGITILIGTIVGVTSIFDCGNGIGKVIANPRSYLLEKWIGDISWGIAPFFSFPLSLWPLG